MPTIGKPASQELARARAQSTVERDMREQEEVNVANVTGPPPTSTAMLQHLQRFRLYRVDRKFLLPSVASVAGKRENFPSRA